MKPRVCERIRLLLLISALPVEVCFVKKKTHQVVYYNIIDKTIFASVCVCVCVLVCVCVKISSSKFNKAC